MNKSVLAYSVAAKELINLAIEKQKLHLARAIQLAIYFYLGVKRKNEQDEVDHSISIVWALWTRGITRDEDLAKAMLHDLVESGKVTVEYIRAWFNDEIADDVNRLTRQSKKNTEIDNATLEKAFKFISGYYQKMKNDWSHRKYLTENRRKLFKMLPRKYKKETGDYFNKLAESPICVVIKNYDKCDISKNMAYSLQIKNQKLQIIEYEAFLALKCKAVRKIEKKYREILFGGRDDIESLIDNVICQIFLKKELKKKKR